MKRLAKMVLLCVFAAIPVISCTEKESTSGSVDIPDLVLTFDKNVIQSNGSDDVSFTVYFKGEDVTASAAIFNVVGSDYKPLGGNVFRTSTPGEYSFQVAYQTSKSSIVIINAIDKDIPSAAIDSDPSNVSFVKRAFLNQHTGANCGNCPVMVRMLKETFFENDQLRDKVVLTAVRNYSGENGFANVGTPPHWPYLYIDYRDSYSHSNPEGPTGLKNKIESITSNPAKVGISASPVYYPEDLQVVVKVTVKAAEEGEYNLGLWLLQDQFYLKQKDDNNIIGSDKSYHYHDNCVRLADSEYLNSHIGYPLGKLKRGETADWVFVMNVKESWWEKYSSEKTMNQHIDENMHFAAFVTSPVKNEKGMTTYPVVNAIDFSHLESAPFDYIK